MTEKTTVGLGTASAVRLVTTAVASSVVLTASWSVAAVPYSEDWSAGNTNGWLQSTTSSVVLRDAGFGNPAGSLVVRRELSPPNFDIGVTSELPQVSGSYAGPPAWMISFDAYYDTGNYTDTWLRFRYQDATFNGWHLDVADSFPASWESYSVMFSPSWTDAQAAAAGWIDETGGTISWQQLMSNVYHPEVRFVIGDETSSAIAHVDNFVLKAIPEPTSGLLLLLASGLLGMGIRRLNR